MANIDHLRADIFTYLDSPMTVTLKEGLNTLQRLVEDDDVVFENRVLRGSQGDAYIDLTLVTSVAIFELEYRQAVDVISLFSGRLSAIDNITYSLNGDKALLVCFASGNETWQWSSPREEAADLSQFATFLLRTVRG